MHQHAVAGFNRDFGQVLVRAVHRIARLECGDRRPAFFLEQGHQAFGIAHGDDLLGAHLGGLPLNHQLTDRGALGEVIDRVRVRAAENGLPPELCEALWRQMIGWFIQYEEEKLRQQLDAGK